jgi:lipoprotein-anchoring transpeptidase ErfK/SrfK
MRSRRPVIAALLTAATIVGAAALAATALQGRASQGAGDAPPAGSGRADPTAMPSDVNALAPPAKPAFKVATPRPLHLSSGVSMWAPVIHPALARTLPRTHARLLARVPMQTPEGTTNILLAVGVHRDSRHRLWVHVRLPILPNNTTGWVRRAALGGYRFVHTRLVVGLQSLEATLYRGRRALFRAPVGVGARGTVTPAGRFYIRDRLTRYASPFYGPIAFGTSARSPVLTDWPAGGYIGIHGTDRPDLIPGRISHGCIRLRNEDIRRLAALMPVGTPVSIEQGR